MNYRPATAADVGRTDVEFSDSGHEWCGPTTCTDYRPNMRFPWVERVAVYRFARVPILPEGCSHEWELIDTATDYWKCGKCGHVPVHSNERIHCAMNSDEQKCEPSFDGVQALHAQVTIRRKLEAGGLAEAEQAILLDGRYYPVEWVKSSPGVLPQQVEIV